MYKLLEKIDSPQDLRKLSRGKLEEVCRELRDYMVECCSVNPGHLGSSLGAVELIVALHYIYNTPEDKIVFDVGHQAYAHKILTGRRDLFRKKITIFTVRKIKMQQTMSEKVYRFLNDNPVARWSALILVALAMFFGYMFVDVMSPPAEGLDASRVWHICRIRVYPQCLRLPHPGRNHPGQDGCAVHRHTLLQPHVLRCGNQIHSGL